MQLREYRENKGLSQYQAAKLLGTTQANISRWERGIAIPNARTIQRIEKLTKGAVSFRDFMRGAA